MDPSPSHLNINTLVLAGGGVRGFAFLGAIMAFQDRFGVDSMLKITQFAGSSVGALTALALALRLPLSVISTIVADLDISEIFRKDAAHLMTTFSLNDGSSLRKAIVTILTGAGCREDITLAGVRDQFQTSLTVVVTDLCSAGVLYMGPDSHPNMPVVKAVQASMALPPLFAPVQHEDMLLVDGGLMDNFPIAAFDPKTTMGINLQWYIDPTPPFDMHAYFNRVLACLQIAAHKVQEVSTSTKPYVVHIDVGSLRPDADSVDVSAVIFKGYRDAAQAMSAWPKPQSVETSPVRFLPPLEQERHQAPAFLTEVLSKIHNK